MHRVGAHDGAPGLLVHGGRRGPHVFQKRSDLTRILRTQRPGEIAVEEQFVKVLPPVGADALAHQDLAHRHLRRGIAHRRHAGHPLAVVQAHGALERRTVHGAADPRRADPEGLRIQDQHLHGVAEGFLRVRDLFHRPADVEIRADDDPAAEAVLLRVEQRESHRDLVRVLDPRRERCQLYPVLRAQRYAVKAPDAASLADQLFNVFHGSPPMCSAAGPLCFRAAAGGLYGFRIYNGILFCNYMRAGGIVNDGNNTELLRNT